MPVPATSSALPVPARLATATPLGSLALALLRFLREGGPRPLVFVARDANRAAALREILVALDPKLAATSFPGWDCPPYDRAPPSHAVMGARMGVLRWLRSSTPPEIVLTTPDALLQRVPPRKACRGSYMELRVGEAIDLDAVAAALKRIGYFLDERVDEPGEAAIRGRVLDLFPAAAPMPCRVEHEDGRITAIRSYDPVTQRSAEETEILIVDPASEIVEEAVDGSEESGVHSDLPEGEEHRLPSFYARLETVFDHAPECRLAVEEGVEERVEAFFDQVAEGFESERAAHEAGRAERAPILPDHLYLRREEWDAVLAERLVLTVEGGSGDAGVARFAAERNAVSAFAAYAAEKAREGCRLVLPGGEGAYRPFIRAIERSLHSSIEPAADWNDVAAAPKGAVLLLPLPLEAGFVDEADGAVVIAPADLLGSRAAARRLSGPVLPERFEDEFHLGDAVVHLDHGLGILEGLEDLPAAEGGSAEAIRLRYADEAKLLVPASEIGSIWRYGGDAEAVTLDRLDGDAWAKRRAKVETEIAATAEAIAELTRKRQETEAPKLVPSRRDYEHFAARFSYRLTPDQAAAVDAVLADMASGHPMDRLVCGDVGYGKTEVALRAAAAAVFAGKQVAIVAPTTVLVQQHLRAFRRRFADFGIEVAQLSRLAKPAEAREVKQRLASGDLRVVVATHALTARGVRLAELGLLIIDEEHRFGAQHKKKLRGLSPTAHVLTMTATPIPRTLQGSLAGLHDLSIVATPPALRQPVRTFVGSLDGPAIAEALRRENQRGGQSYIVCSRVADMAPMAVRLKDVVPELDIVAAHGKMPPEEMEATMLAFAEGKGDVLLATNIIESGLDVPNANTMIVWRADRFGMAQLHQLRGRVGRGRRRGAAFLLTQPDTPLSPEAERRLQAIADEDRLGAGFALSARDLDLRGAGDLLGEEQAGHVKLIGLGLYEHLLERASKRREDGDLEEDWSPDLRLGVPDRIPDTYLPNEEVRLNVYARLAAAPDAAALATLKEELSDRYGEPPDEMADLYALAEIRILCRALGIVRLDGGPQAVAASFRPGAVKELEADVKAVEDLEWAGERLVLRRSSESAPERLRLAGRLLSALE